MKIFFSEAISTSRFMSYQKTEIGSVLRKILDLSNRSKQMILYT